MAPNKKYQIVVWGATGFVGQLVCEHIARDYAGQFSWAMAGRSAEKLARVRDSQLAPLSAQCKDVPLLTGDISDQASIDRVVAEAQVVLCTTGPFARMATPVVDACVRHGTHYCDITGEVPWVRRMIDRYHEQAAARGVKIVHMCGYDSIPSDLGSLFVADYIQRRLHRKTSSVTMLVGKSRAAASGGTIASAFEFFKAPRAERAVAADPYALNPPGTLRGPDSKDLMFVGRVPELNAWTMPFIMAMVNSRVVRRSRALLGAAGPYGDDFSYHEAVQMPGLVSAVVGSVIMGLALGALALLSPARALAKRVLPKPGEGPTKEQQVNGFWNHAYVARTQEPAGAQPQVVIADMRGHRDPGYWDTSRMLLEAGLCLVQQEHELQEAGLLQGGVLTPASAMGTVLIRRLQQRGGIDFSVRGQPGYTGADAGGGSGAAGGKGALLQGASAGRAAEE